MCVACTTFGTDGPSSTPLDAAATDSGALDAAAADSGALDSGAPDASFLACPSNAFCDDFDAPELLAKWDGSQYDGGGAVKREVSGTDGSFLSTFGAVSEPMQAHALLLKLFAPAISMDASFDVTVAAWTDPSATPTGKAVLAQIEAPGGGPSVTLSINAQGQVTVDTFDGGTTSFARFGDANFRFDKSVRVSFHVSFGPKGTIVVGLDGINVVTSDFAASTPGSASLRLGGQHYFGALPGFRASYDRVRVLAQ